MRDSSIDSLREVFAFSFPDRITKLSMEKQETYEWIIKNPAFRDFTPRTVKGLRKEQVVESLDSLAENVFKYIHNGKDQDYEIWHRETCEAFIDDFNQKSRLPIKYGKAQKMLNMTMKYLYCLPDARKYSAKFKPCHMPLDSFTLEWFCDLVLPIYNAGLKRFEQVSKTKIMNTSWSNLECGDTDTEYSYLWIQKQIRDFLKSNNNHTYYDVAANRALTPFEAEFYIWPEQQFIKAYYGIVSLGVLKESYPTYTDEELHEKCDEIIGAVKVFQKKLSVPQK